jgi:hypothetical protein
MHPAMRELIAVAMNSLSTIQQIIYEEQGFTPTCEKLSTAWLELYSLKYPDIQSEPAPTVEELTPTI